MMLQQVPVLALVFALVAVAGWFGLQWLQPRWEQQLATYVGWMLARREEMFEPMSALLARRIVIGGTVGGALLGFAMGGPLLGLILTIAGYNAPYGWLRFAGRRRLKKLDDQLVDGLILMANGLKSGLTLLQAIELGAEELNRPARDEFGRLLKEIRLGTAIDDALAAMAERIPLPDLEIAVHSILTLRETGGNLAETFMTVAQTIMDRKKVEGRIEALTAQGVYQGYMVSAMPFLLCGLFYVMDPDYIMPLFTTPLGWMICAVVVLLDIAGFWLIMKVVRVDV